MRVTVEDVDEETGRRLSNLAGMGTRAALLAGALLLSACGGGGGGTSSATVPADGTTSTTARRTTTTTTDPDAAIREEVEQAYFAQWDAFVEILETPDPNNPLINDHFTGVARERVLDVVSEFVARGYVARRPDDQSLFRPAIQRVEVAGDRALVVECTVDGLLKVDLSSGAIVDDDVSTAHLANWFVRRGGVWKVESTDQASAGEPPCD